MDKTRERCALGIDIGGTKIAAAVVTVRGELVLKARRPKPDPSPW